MCLVQHFVTSLDYGGNEKKLSKATEGEEPTSNFSLIFMGNGGLQVGFKPRQHPGTQGGSRGEGRTASNNGAQSMRRGRPDKPECEVILHGCEELNGGCVDTIKDHEVSRLPSDPEKESGQPEWASEKASTMSSTVQCDPTRGLSTDAHLQIWSKRGQATNRVTKILSSTGAEGAIRRLQDAQTAQGFPSPRPTMPQDTDEDLDLERHKSVPVQFMERWAAARFVKEAIRIACLETCGCAPNEHMFVQHRRGTVVREGIFKHGEVHRNEVPKI
jgi:hypothetical protein